MLGPLRRKVREYLLERWQVSYSPIAAVPPCVYRRFHNSGPITLVDIGAHTGLFTTGLNAVCPVKEAMLVEPIEALAKELAREPALSGYQVFDCAVSDFDGEIDINFFPNAPYISSALPLDRSVGDLAQIAKTDAICV